MFRIIKNMFIVLLISLVNASSHAKFVSLSDQKCEIQPTFINLNPDEYSQEWHYYPLAVKLDKSVGNCNTLIDLSSKVWVPNKTEDLNIHVFNMITEIEIQIKSGITINVDASVSIENIIYVKKIIFGIQLHVVVKM